MKLNARELATVLHGLRMVQEQRETAAAKRLREAGLGCTQRGTRCEHFDDAASLSDREIDALCERIKQARRRRLHLQKDRLDAIHCRSLLEDQANVEEYDPASAER